MQIPFEISFRNVEKTENLDNLVREKVDKLEKVCEYMTSFRMAVELPQKHMQSGNPYRIRIEINVPHSHKIVAKREPGEGSMHDDISTIIRSAFAAAERQLKAVTERQHGEIKKHPRQEIQAVVHKLLRDEGYGFLKTIDNRELYFHENSVLHDDFSRLEIGTGVRFVEEIGEKGPQARSVHIVDKPGSRILY
jgi:cold shock CspA family protein/ribosome-associated translation inhibitor RaiA